ncbi:MAG: FecR domain-containing protein [Burkholderiales bacterium]|nr:FecR domain-containing protein [Burkholderiales bacterium]
MHRLVRYVFLFALTLAGLAHATVVGRIEAEGGQVERWGADGQPRTAHVFAHIEQGDLITTGPDGWVVLSMVDSASLTLKGNSRMRIGDYDFKPAEPKRSNIFLELLTGSLRSITGLIGHSNPQAYLVKTPTATMGIRGTDHEILVITQPDELQTPVGTYDHVYDGRTVMRTVAGSLELTAGETGVAHPDGRVPEHMSKQPAAYDKLQKFAKEKGIDAVLERLHRHSGQGFGLPPNVTVTTSAEPKTADKPATESSSTTKADTTTGSDADAAKAGTTSSKDASDKPTSDAKSAADAKTDKPAADTKTTADSDSKAVSTTDSKTSSTSTEKKTTPAPVTPPAPPPKHK